MKGTEYIVLITANKKRFKKVQDNNCFFGVTNKITTNGNQIITAIKEGIITISIVCQMASRIAPIICTDITKNLNF